MQNLKTALVRKLQKSPFAPTGSFREPTIPKISKDTLLNLTTTPQAATRKIARVDMRVIELARLQQ
jgi:hypothetical protein